MYSIDIERGNYSPIFNCGLGDTKTEQFRITKLGNPIIFTTPVFQLNIKKSDGNFVHQTDRITYAEGVVTINFDVQCFTSPGVTAAELLIVENGRTTTSRFFFYVRKTLDNSIIESFDKVKTLEDLEKYLEKAYQDLNEYGPRLEFLETNNINLNRQLTEAEQSREVAEGNRNKAESDRGTTFNTLKTNMDKATQDVVNTNNIIALEEEKRVAAESDRALSHNNKMTEAGTAINTINSTDAIVEKNETNRELTFTRLKGEMESATNAAIATEQEIVAEEVKRKATYEQVKKDEATRNQSEVNRVEAEKTRASLDAGREARIKNVEEQSDQIAKDVNVVDKKVISVEKYQANSNVDIEGNVHEDLANRLQTDFDKVNHRYDELRYLENSGTYITQDKISEGVTKDTVIKGRTLQNLLKFNKQKFQNDMTYAYREIDLSMLKDGDKYTIKAYNVGSSITNFNICKHDGTLVQFTPSDINDAVTFTKMATPEYGTMLFVRGKVLIDSDLADLRFLILEGDYTNKPIPPYFEGIRSVNEDTENMEIVNCGKNLLDGDMFRSISNWYHRTPTDNRPYQSFRVKVTPNTRYILGKKTNGSGIGTEVYLNFTNKCGVAAALESEWLLHPSAPIYNNGRAITTSTSDGYVYINSYGGQTGLNRSLDLVEALDMFPFTESPSPYEPYVSHTQPLTMKNLRSLPNGVCDTSDGFRRIGKVVLDGSENWVCNQTQPTDTSLIRFAYKNNDLRLNNVTLSDKFNISLGLTEGINIPSHERYLHIIISKSKLTTPDLAGFKAWLKANPTTVYYELAEPTIEPKGLQTEFSTYEGINNTFTQGSLITPEITSKYPVVIGSRIHDIENELNKGRTAFDGTIHTDVDERIDYEIDKVMNRFNNASMLPHEGEYIYATNTYEGRTKDLEVRGKTLQNLWDYNSQIQQGIKDGGYIKLVSTGQYPVATQSNITLYKPNTLYTVIVEVIEYTLDTSIAISVGNNRSIFPPLADRITGVGITKRTITTRPSFIGCDWGLHTALAAATIGYAKFRLLILEGDYTNKPIPPYFEGIRSVGEQGENVEVVSCGKNLFNGGMVKGTIYGGDGTSVPNHDSRQYTEQYIKIQGTSATISSRNKKWVGVFGYDENKKYLGYMSYASVSATYSHSMLKYVRISTEDLEPNAIQLEQSPTPTPYEPYKEHRQSLPLTEPLRGIGNVRDTDKVTRIGKAVLDEHDTVIFDNTLNDRSGFVYRKSLTDKLANLKLRWSNTFISSRFKNTMDDNSKYESDFCIAGSSDERWSVVVTAPNSTLKISNDDSIGTKIDKYKTWVKNNNIDICFELENPIPKESPLEQLRTYDGTTNIFTEGSLITPTVSAKIPSNVPAVVATLNEENTMLKSNVNTLNIENTEVKATNETQDVLIDTTMLATDEMYMMIEPLLSQQPQVLNVKGGSSKMVDMYVAMVIRGLKTIDEVPARYRAEVQAILDKLEK